MTSPVVPQPYLLTDPGVLWMAPLGTAEPTPVSAAGRFTDAIPAAWLMLGPTDQGSTFSDSVNTDTISVAEFMSVIKTVVTGRTSHLSFALASWTLTNYRRAINGGIAAIAPQGTVGSEVTKLEPPVEGSEVRAMLLWESTDRSIRLLGRQCFQTGEVSSDFRPGADRSLIPCDFQFEQPTTGLRPWAMWAAGGATGRVGA
jgi:hypothetical protein